jgi:hypothetical protein
MSTFQFYKEQIFSNWTLMRMVKFVLSIIILIQSVQQHDLMFGFLGGIFLTQTLLNIGCCGVGGCSVPVKKVDSSTIQDVQFEEIKENKK